MLFVIIFPLALVRSLAKVSLPNEILAWACLVSDHRVNQRVEGTYLLFLVVRSGLRWNSTGPKAHLRKAYVATMRVNTSLRMKHGKLCGWEHMSRIRRSCKG